MAQEHQSRPPVEAAWPYVSQAGWVVAVGASRPRPAGLLATVREGRHGRDESGRYGKHAWVYIVDGWAGRVRLSEGTPRVLPRAKGGGRTLAPRKSPQVATNARTLPPLVLL